MKKFLFKFIIIFFACAILAILLIAGTKFFGAAKNIYKLEGLSAEKIANQIKQIISSDNAPLLADQEGRINILLLGIAGPGHGGENLTDTIMILSISADKKSIAIGSIPRDLYIELDQNNYKSKINYIYTYYNDKNDPRQGIKALSQTVKKVTGFSPTYYVLADFEGFKKLIDAVGELDYTLEEDLYDPTFPNNSNGYEPLSLKAGEYHLDGDLALKLARSRHTTQGDLSRISRQHQIIKLLRQKLDDKEIWNNIFKMNEILNILSENIKTNITLPEMQELNDIAKGISSENIQSKIPSLDAQTGLITAAKINGADVLLPKDNTYEELKAFYQGK